MNGEENGILMPCNADVTVVNQKGSHSSSNPSCWLWYATYSNPFASLLINFVYFHWIWTNRTSEWNGGFSVNEWKWLPGVWVERRAWQSGFVFSLFIIKMCAEEGEHSPVSRYEYDWYNGSACHHRRRTFYLMYDILCRRTNRQVQSVFLIKQS